jgi:hypothetical protein
MPFTLSRLQYVTSRAGNAEALRLHLAAFINRLGRHPPSPIMVQRRIPQSVFDDGSLTRLDQQFLNLLDAFEILRAASPHRNTKLRDVARDIITPVSGKPPPPGEPFRI